jgi:hypothetical protein
MVSNLQSTNQTNFVGKFLRNRILKASYIPKDVHRNSKGIFSYVGCLSRIENFHYNSFALYFKGNYTSTPTTWKESFVFLRCNQTNFNANSILQNLSVHYTFNLVFILFLRFGIMQIIEAWHVLLNFMKIKRTQGETCAVNLPVSNLLNIFLAMQSMCTLHLSRVSM